ncbi:hypothetical protein [Aureispira sp. CCB-E]|uniref:hypothetical protein n=1 Tax=Aureispira sp. CCB-E TaxID=3051121 RepID=UPI0028687D70|nr:hypothetical protein [Aureispira sp. CCB-E]WMX17102.1 hypothetical protein QP953_12030 [Aureispira sp. CCB-E]
MSQQIDIQPTVFKGSLETSFFDMIDKKATYHAGKDKMETYQKERKKGDKRVTPYTHDLFHAIIRAVAPTMEDIKKHQRELYEECRATGQYFCFTTIPSLQTMLNDTQHHAALTPKDKTVYNQIKLMLEIGIITEKVNYVQTGHRNPFPCEKSPSGRGKFQLWINPEVLCIKAKYEGSAASDNASFFEAIGKSLPQYRTSSLLYKDKELKSITNTPLDVDKAALPVGKLNPSNIQDKGREIKSKPVAFPTFPPQNWSKKQFSSFKLWELMRYNLYQNRVFNEQTNTECQLLLESLLDQAEKHVQAYRKAKIQSFEQNPAYLVAKNQPRMLKNFAARLPNVERSAVEIVAHAIIKQEKHAQKKGYTLWYPVNYLNSIAAQKAFGYSVDDWDRIQANYFDKNRSSKAYFEQIQWMNSHYSKMLELLPSDGAKRVYELTNQAYWKWYQGIKRDPNLSESKIKELTNLFIQKFKPLLNDEHLQRQYQAES